MVCLTVSKKMNHNGDFVMNKSFYFVIGFVFPIIGILGGYVNLHKDDDDSRPFWIMLLGIILVISSLFVDAAMIRDLFTGGSINGSPED